MHTYKYVVSYDNNAFPICEHVSEKSGSIKDLSNFNINGRQFNMARAQHSFTTILAQEATAEPQSIMTRAHHHKNSITSHCTTLLLKIAHE